MGGSGFKSDKRQIKSENVETDITLFSLWLSFSAAKKLSTACRVEKVTMNRRWQL